MLIFLTIHDAFQMSARKLSKFKVRENKFARKFSNFAQSKCANEVLTLSQNHIFKQIRNTSVPCIMKTYSPSSPHRTCAECRPGCSGCHGSDPATRCHGTVLNIPIYGNAIPTSPILHGTSITFQYGCNIISTNGRQCEEDRLK